MKPTANGVRDDWQTSSTLQALLGSGEQRVGGWAFLQCSLCWLTQAAQNSRFEAAYRMWSCSLPGAAWQSIMLRAGKPAHSWARVAPPLYRRRRRHRRVVVLSSVACKLYRPQEVSSQTPDNQADMGPAASSRTRSRTGAGSAARLRPPEPLGRLEASNRERGPAAATHRMVAMGPRSLKQHRHDGG